MPIIYFTYLKKQFIQFVIDRAEAMQVKLGNYLMSLMVRYGILDNHRADLRPGPLDRLGSTYLNPTLLYMYLRCLKVPTSKVV